jgi:hypothetical protein
VTVVLRGWLARPEWSTALFAVFIVPGVANLSQGA